MSSDNGHKSYEQGKQDGYTKNPNANPPQTSFENQKYWDGRREADYNNGQKSK